MRRDFNSFKFTAFLFLGLMIGSVAGVVLPPVFAARNASGTFSLVSGNPVVTGTTISSTTYNDTLSDIATALTDSLSRSGKGAMTAALELANGTVALPGLSFDSDTDCGLYRIGTNNVGLAIAGVKTVDFSATTTNFYGQAGDGVRGTGGTGGRGVVGIGAASNSGGEFVGGSNFHGVVASGGVGSSNGVYASGDGTGHGIEAYGGDSSGKGVLGTGGAPNGNGVTGIGTGSGSGIAGTGGATGVGGVFTGGTTGDALNATASAGNGCTCTGAGAGTAGVNAASTTSYALSISGDPTSPAKAALRFIPQDAEPTGAHSVGDMYVTSAGVLKICTAAGTPGTWVSVGGQ